MTYTTTLGLILLLSYAVVIGSILQKGSFGEHLDILGYVVLAVFTVLSSSPELILGHSLSQAHT
jgi:hypothetical protein